MRAALTNGLKNNTLLAIRVRLCLQYRDQHPDSIVSRSEEIVVSPRHLLTLLTPAWLVDTVIQAWCALICDVQPRCYAYSPHEIPDLERHGLLAFINDPTSQTTQPFHPRLNIDPYHIKILFPLHVGKDHWSLAVADVENSNITCNDSCPSLMTLTQQMAANQEPLLNGKVPHQVALFRTKMGPSYGDHRVFKRTPMTAGPFFVLTLPPRS